eukprot:3513380-Pyramimonas_sp.AAC.1
MDCAEFGHRGGSERADTTLLPYPQGPRVHHQGVRSRAKQSQSHLLFSLLVVSQAEAVSLAK